MNHYDPNQFVPQPRRSAIPKVIGILMIIFGGLGVLSGFSSIVMGGMSGGFAGDGAISTFFLYSKIANFVGLAIAGTEVFAGIALVTYREKGIRLAMIYAITNIAVTVVSAIALFAWLLPMLDRSGFGGMLGVGMMFGLLVSIAWPTIVLVLVTRPAARAACSGL